MNNLLIIFICIMVYKIAVNLYYRFKLKRYMNEYFDWIANGNNPEKVFKNAAFLREIIRNAGVSDMHIATTDPIGYGYVSTGNASVLESHPIKRSPFTEKMVDIMYQALGVYERRAWETINPVYWINFVTYLPRELCCYIGAPYNFMTKTIQVAWWIIAGLSSVAISLYPNLVRNFIEKLFSS